MQILHKSADNQSIKKGVLFLLSNDESFFNENVVNINSIVAKIILCSSIVPVTFVIMTLLGVWVVPHLYSIFIFSYCFGFSTVFLILNKYKKGQIICMYLEILVCIFFVNILGIKNIINISIAYCFAPFISCLYYNRRLTNITCIITYLSMMGVFWIRSRTINQRIVYTTTPETPLQWFISHSIGVTVEFIFVFLISGFMTRRTHKTLQNLVKANTERDYSYLKLQDRNEFIVSLNKELEEKNKNLLDTQYRIINFVAQCLGSHDLFTGRHVIHTQKYVEIICKELVAGGDYVEELTDEKIKLLSTAAFLHDIGKLHVPEGVLNKLGKFTPEEFVIMKSHPTEGKKLLEFLPKIENGDFNKIAIEMAYSHHEKWDGSGYPEGISKFEIPLSARIMAAADVLDALVSQRLYKEAINVEDAMLVFEKSKGHHFEPCIADAVIRLKPIITIIDQDFKTAEASTNAEELEWWQRYHDNLRI